MPFELVELQINCVGINCAFKHEMIGLLPNIYSNFELSGTSN